MQPLVSIIVVTYNSARFLMEALESIAAQTWQELELIITDDYSTDNTVSLCRDWMAGKKNRFVRTEIITVPKNTGIAANCNRGLNAADGEWIKYCAGDDALFPNCIEDNMHYIESKPDAKILFSYAKTYLDTFEEKNFIRIIPAQKPGNIINEEITAEEQYRLLLISDRITFTPSSFINRQTQIAVGGFNEQVQLQEDYPLWLNLTKAGYKLHFMEKETVRYRQHGMATNNMTTEYLIKPNYFRTEKFRREYIYPNLPWDIRWNERLIWYGSQIFKNDRLNRNTGFNRLLRTFLTSWINPFKYFLYLKKKLAKDISKDPFYK
ncbi:glycosyltransferase family 2 protein [Ferruginibacter paludis]|uniref:glycosyltransferase family 2 protein n=1 Tax=Ferruginibacter paludis TaxID=1310417 RepID=UPI0025B3BC51|nr:glycosyltransferase family 2 protein [Ferruginibacter paludis]MDN3658901.1 glycosyltransferase family 2 protein [Ferruginibacter paludis]